MDDLAALICEAEQLGIYCREVGDLRQMLTDTRGIVRAAQEVCQDPSKYCEALASQANDLELPESEPLKLIRSEMEWVQGSQRRLNLEECDNMLSLGRELSRTGEQDLPR